MHRLSLADLWTVYRLQRSGIRLDVRGAVVEPDPPLYLAVRDELLPWRQQVKTVVVRRGDRERRQAGFVQLHRRSSQPAMDIVFIAPSLDRGAGVAWLWKHLLNDAVKVAGMANAQRVYAHVPASRHAEVEVLRQAGFALYAQDQLYRMNVPAHWPDRPDTPTWQPQTTVDDWGLARLYHAITPAVVQQAETIGSTTDGQNGSAVHCWGENRNGCYVIRIGETIRGYLRLTPGKRGHWLKMVLHPEISDQGERLLHEALGLMNGWPKQPVFSDVREYEGYLTDALERCGFRHVMTRRLLVHHTTVRVPAVEQKWTKLIEQSPTQAPTVSSNQIQQYEVKLSGKANNYG